MKKLFFLITAVIFLSCGENSDKNQSYLPDSVGGINGLQVVITDALWQGPLGDSIRAVFASPVQGLPQEEPLFTLNQLPLAQFSDFARTYRNVLHISLTERDTVAIRQNAYAQPQTIVFVQGQQPEDIIRQLSDTQNELTQMFLDRELKERQRRTLISPLGDHGLQGDFGIDLKIPSAYRAAAQTKEYYWLRKELKANGTTNILIYQVPLASFPEGISPIVSIQKIRDSIGAALLPVEDGSKFITESSYELLTEQTTIQNRLCYVTKGLWTIDDAYMAGPFVSFAVRDESRDRYLIMEGFTYAPSMAKRDLQFELEAILRPVEFQ